MDQQTLSDAWDKLWRNYCISDSYEPGSTYKPFTIASGLETGKNSQVMKVIPVQDQLGTVIMKSIVITGQVMEP